MIRYFCDVCNTETPDGGLTSNRIKGTAQATGADGSSRPVNVEIIVGLKGWNDGIVCASCVHSAVTWAFDHNLRARK